jgi:chitinase
VAAKTAYIKKNKLGGAYVWALSDDDANGSLTKAIAAGLK